MMLALEERAMKDDILIGDTPKAKRRRKRLKGVETAGRLWKHSTLADVDGLLTADRIDRAFVFTMVRNPWDRMVSYYHWLQDQTFDHPAVRLAKANDFAGNQGRNPSHALWALCHHGDGRRGVRCLHPLGTPGQGCRAALGSPWVPARSVR
jgi:hypothetical protein